LFKTKTKKKVESWLIKKLMDIDTEPALFKEAMEVESKREKDEEVLMDRPLPPRPITPRLQLLIHIFHKPQTSFTDRNARTPCSCDGSFG
jgi:hypothetical protein